MCWIENRSVSFPSHATFIALASFLTQLSTLTNSVSTVYRGRGILSNTFAWKGQRRCCNSLSAVYKQRGPSHMHEQETRVYAGGVGPSRKKVHVTTRKPITLHSFTARDNCNISALMLQCCVLMHSILPSSLKALLYL